MQSAQGEGVCTYERPVGGVEASREGARALCSANALSVFAARGSIDETRSGCHSYSCNRVLESILYFFKYIYCICSSAGGGEARADAECAGVGDGAGARGHSARARAARWGGGLAHAALARGVRLQSGSRKVGPSSNPTLHYDYSTSILYCCTSGPSILSLLNWLVIPAVHHQLRRSIHFIPYL